MLVCHCFMVPVSKVSFEYVDFHAKMSLIFYPAFGNSITKRTLLYNIHCHKCLVLLLGQNIFCPGQNWNCPRQNFCPGLKTTFFAFKSHAKWIFVVENRFPIRKFCFKWLLKAKNVLFNPGQNLYLGQFKFCLGQKIFCPSKRTRH